MNIEDPLVLGAFNVIDLTHPLDSSIPSWNGSCGFHQEIKMDYDRGCRVLSYKCHAGCGTHIDAPSHFFSDARHVGDISLKELIVPAHVIDVSDRRSGDLFVTIEDLNAFELQYGRILPNSLVFAYTGWGHFWSDKDKYRNEDKNGKMQFPGFSAEVAKQLVERGVAGIGIDSLSPDGSNQGFPVHEVMLGQDKYIIENVANLEKMPKTGAFVICFPLNVREGTEAPVRLAGLISK